MRDSSGAILIDTEALIKIKPEAPVALAGDRRDFIAKAIPPIRKPQGRDEKGQSPGCYTYRPRTKYSSHARVHLQRFVSI